MAVRAYFVAVSTDTLARLRNEPETLLEFLYPNDGQDEPPPNCVDLDKAWQGIHYLLTGEAEGGAEPLSLAVFGGEVFGPDDVGWEAARFLTPEQVVVVSGALSGLTREDLLSRFNPKDMAAKDIYPERMWGGGGKGAFGYLMENYPTLVAFYRDAAARGDAVIQWLG
jgi:hypothetical protein